MVSREQVIEVLQSVEDPEIFMDIWFLGLVYDVRIAASRVSIDMTLTTPMCPAGPAMIDEVKEKVGALEGVESVDVKLVFSPPWQPSDEVKAALGLI